MDWWHWLWVSIFSNISYLLCCVYLFLSLALRILERNYFQFRDGLELTLGENECLCICLCLPCSECFLFCVCNAALLSPHSPTNPVLEEHNRFAVRFVKSVGIITTLQSTACRRVRQIVTKKIRQERDSCCVLCAANQWHGYRHDRCCEQPVCYGDSVLDYRWKKNDPVKQQSEHFQTFKLKWMCFSISMHQPVKRLNSQREDGKRFTSNMGGTQ